jgi:hypothetical protein
VFNDKEAITAWGNGNAIVTWTVFNQGQAGSYLSSPIYASVTHDGGRNWSRGVAISGSASFCASALGGGTTCDQDQGSVPAVAADGSIYVSFLNYPDTASGRSQYLVVKLDPVTGKPVGNPAKVTGVYDGFTDYPIDDLGWQTYQDSQFRTWAFGNIATDPKNTAHLAVVWTDMRNSQLPAPSDPYQAKTNSDVIVSQSTDAGKTWSAPTALTAPGDQFMPWTVYDTAGELRIGFFDRSYDPANHRYGYTLATEQRAGSLRFINTQVTTALSDPTQGDRWFAGGVPSATVFLGDYSGIAATPSGGIASLWTDLRNPVTFNGRTGTGQDAYFARSK